MWEIFSYPFFQKNDFLANLIPRKKLYMDVHVFIKLFFSKEDNSQICHHFGSLTGNRTFDLATFDLATPKNPPGSFCEAEGRADPMSVQSWTRPKAEENFVRATESNADEAEGRGALLSGGMITLTHLVSGQLFGSGSWLGLGSMVYYDWGILTKLRFLYCKGEGPLHCQKQFGKFYEKIKLS